ncbi:hypothetical protein CcaCcLH18_00604 [Colletotrichum camelliae]|nr:hypothetical protein CcaCcLH18_00604 [Colletotrichum camelliae]
MRIQAFVLLAVATVAFAGDPPAALPRSKDPKRCLERLDELPNRSGTRLDILNGRCVKARTYRGKYGPYNGHHFFEACCKNSKGEFREPTSVDLNNCQLKRMCSKCVLEQEFTFAPVLKCQCKGDDGKVAESQIEIRESGKLSGFWVDDEGELHCERDNGWFQ